MYLFFESHLLKQHFIRLLGHQLALECPLQDALVQALYLFEALLDCLSHLIRHRKAALHFGDYAMLLVE